MEHYRECFKTMLDSFTVIELDQKQCTRMETIFRFKLESLMLWSYHDLTTEVKCYTGFNSAAQSMLACTDFESESIEELQYKFGRFYNQFLYRELAQLSTYKTLYKPTLKSVQQIFEQFQKICCCYECFPDRKLFVYYPSKLSCLYRKKPFNSQIIYID